MRSHKHLMQTLNRWCESGHKPLSYGIQGKDEAWTAYITWELLDKIPVSGAEATGRYTMHDPQELVFVDENDAALRGQDLYEQANAIYQDRIELDRIATTD